METLKTLCTLLLMTVSMAVSAQNVIVIEKTDGTKDQYPLSEVDSVVYEPKKETVYYYYAGWTCPNSVEELANAITEQYPVSSTNNTLHYAGGSNNTNTGFSFTNPFGVIDNNLYYKTAKTNYYIVIPNNMSIYDPEGVSAIGAFSKQSEFDNYIVWKSNTTSRNINNFLLY